MASRTTYRFWQRPAWARPAHPVYRLETNRAARSAPLTVLQQGCLPLMLAVGGLAALTVSALTFVGQVGYDVESALLTTLPASAGVLLLVQVVFGAAANILMVAQAAPLISGEVELQSWGLLRTTTLPLREIVLAKFWAVMDQLRGSLIGLMMLRMASAGTVVLTVVFLLLREMFYYMSASEWKHMLGQQLWLAPTVAVLLFVVWYTLQPVMQYVLNAAVGLAVSTFARTRGRAIAMALATRLVLWLTSITLNGGLIYLLGYLLIANWSQPQYAPLEWFSQFQTPSDRAISLVLGGTAAVYVIGIALIQVGLAALALGVAQRRARRLGG